jgi:hypothetical protein
VSRIVLQVEPRECSAANAVRTLAESVEELCYGLDALDTPPDTVRALHRAQRVLKPVTEFYFGDESPLVWSPPDYKFKPKGSK